MSLREDLQARWQARIARARLLAGEYPAAAQMLTFYASLAEQQAALVAALPIGRGSGEKLPHGACPTPASFRETLDVAPALRAVPTFLPWLTLEAPRALSDAADRLVMTMDTTSWERALRAYVADDTAVVDDAEPAKSFVVAAVIQPFAEALAAGWRTTPAGSASLSQDDSNPLPSASCPLCGGRPVVGALREASHGAQRSLVCSFCLGERPYLRVLCPACSEQRFDALPVYTTDVFAHVRIDACDTCRTYVKTIDLTKDGHAVPIVDDLASVTMDLWARERGYARICPNLLRG